MLFGPYEKIRYHYIKYFKTIRSLQQTNATKYFQEKVLFEITKHMTMWYEVKMNLMLSSITSSTILSRQASSKNGMIGNGITSIRI